MVLACSWPLLLALSCQAGPDDFAPLVTAALVESIEGSDGAPGKLTICAAAGRCRELAKGDVLEPGRLVAEGGTSARIGALGLHLTLAPEASVTLGERWAIEAGNVTIDVDSEHEGALLVGKHALHFDQGRPALVSVSRTRLATTVSVWRGRLALEQGGQSLWLSRGQSAELDAEHAVARYEASGASEPIRGQAEGDISENVAVRGLGRMTARRPGTEAVVAGVVLAKHDVSVVIRDGVATTTVEEVFENETNQVLEGRFVFPVPPSASISDLVLWVGDTPVSAELVEKRRAAAIFKGIVDDTVRPRDPALLEWSRGRELSLKIFPIDAKSSRRVRFTFEEPINDLGGAGRFVYPMSAGTDRATRIKEVSLRVRIEGENVSDVATPRYAATVATEKASSEVSFSARGFAPTNDFVVTYRTAAQGGAVAVAEPETACEGDRRVCPPTLPGASLVRASLGVPDSQLPAAIEGDRVLVLDVSASQTSETLAAQVALTARVLGTLESSERFAILACDSACEAYPADGLAAFSPEVVVGAGEWLGRLTPAGSSDVGGALAHGLSLLRGSEARQLVYLGDGAASAGELSVDAIVGRALQRDEAPVDVRVIGTGRNVDELVLRALARGLGGTFDVLDASAEREVAVGALAFALSQPVLRDIEVDLPTGFSFAVEPPRSLRLGDELRLATIAATNRAGERGELVVRGRLGDEDFEQRVEIVAQAGPHGFASRSVARAQIDALEARGGKGALDVVVDLSKTFFVMSRQTSMLVLENDAMFRSFGIERTRGGRSVAAPVMSLDLRVPSEPTRSPMAELDRASEATGSTWGSSFGDSVGSGGLGLSGIGEGGGGVGLGAIGLGNISTLGKGAGTGTGTGFGAGEGRLGGAQKSTSPSVRMGATSVSGRLPPEVIQRIVRQNFGRFRLCYENALRQNPSLNGRVTVSFVIGTNGSVSGASGNGSGIGDSVMVACVVRAFHGLSFPQPEAGVVKVTYPIVFSPDGSQPAAPRSPVLAMSPPQISDGDDGWVNRGAEVVTRLEADVARDPSKRSARSALVRGLLARGRFSEAVSRATEYAAIDPDRSEPLELYAQALLASGEIDKALRVLDSTAELEQGRSQTHRRIARAFEARGDERRACAHWISVAALEKNEAALREAWRCRARSAGDTEAVLEEIDAFSQRMAAPSSALLGLMRSIKSANVAAYEWPAASSDEVRLSLACASERASCPVLVTVDDKGRVSSDHMPDAEARRFQSSFNGGTYRALLVGGDANQAVTVSLTVQGHARKTELRRAQRATALLARVEPTGFGWGAGFGRSGRTMVY